MSILSKTVDCVSNSAQKLELTLLKKDGNRVNFRFANGAARTNDPEILRCLLDYPTRNRPGEAGFTIMLPDEECEALISGEKPKATPVALAIPKAPPGSMQMKVTADA